MDARSRLPAGDLEPGARPAHSKWFQDVRDQCAAAGVAFFFKQHGDLIHHAQADGEQRQGPVVKWMNPETGRSNTFYRVGKKAAGHLLDGREWREFPTPATQEKRA